MKKEFFLFTTLAILITDTIFIGIVKAEAKGNEPYVVVECEESRIYEEVFGVDSGTDFVPGYYEPIVDESIPLSPQEQFDVKDKCEEYGIDYYLILSMMYEESRFKADAVSKNKKCKGILQLNTKFFDVEDYFDVVQNTDGGCQYMKKLLADYDLPLALMIWHGESDAKTKYKNGITSAYARRVMERRDVYAETVKYPGDGRTEEQNKGNDKTGKSIRS